MNQCPERRCITDDATAVVASLWVWQICLEEVGCDCIDPFALVATALAHDDPEVQQAVFDSAYFEACHLLAVEPHEPRSRPFDDVGDSGGVLPDHLLPWIGKARELHTMTARPVLDEMFGDPGADGTSVAVSAPATRRARSRR